MSYSIEEHKHRFAAWAAGNAANKGYPFTVEQGQQILKGTGLKDVAKDINNLPAPDKFDNKHLEWREAVRKSANDIFGLKFKHGVAAKLINVYLKSVFVCSNNHDDPRVRAIHPPIDRALLVALCKENIVSKDSKGRVPSWSKFDNAKYQRVISAIKEVLPNGAGLWQIEKHWQGHQ